MAQIKIEDLSPFTELTPEEMARILGAGPFRPSLEALEDRQLLSSSVISTLPVTGQPNVSFQFNIDSNMNLTETKVQVVGNGSKVLGAEKLGSTPAMELFQGHDAAGHQAAFLNVYGNLMEFTPNTGMGTFTQLGTPNANQVVQDKGLDLFFDQGGVLYEATGTPVAGSAGAHQIAPNVQAVYQAKDSTGQPAAFALENGKLYQETASGQQQVGGLTNVTQAVVNGARQLYALQGNVLYTVSGTTAKQAVSNVTQLAVDPAGEVVVLQGPHAYTYLSTGGLESQSTTIATNPSALPQYALDSQGRLFQLSDGVLTMSTSSTSGFHQVAGMRGITQMAVDSAGEIVVVQGVHAHYYIDYSGQPTGVSSPSAQYALDSHGDLYQLNGGVLSVSTSLISGYQSVPGMTGVTQMLTPTSGSIVVLKKDGSVWQTTGGSFSQLGTSGVAASDGSIWFLGTASVDKAGDEALYHLSNGQMTSVCVTSAAIGTKWLGMGGPSSSLGLPVQDVRPASVGSNKAPVQIQLFQFGQIYAPQNGPVQVLGIPSSSGGLGLWEGFTVSEVSPDAIDQTMAGTCSFLSALSSVARTDPQLLANHLHQNSDGTWSVTLFNAQSGKWQTLTVSLTSFNAGDPLPGPNNTNFWTAVFQRAYLQLMNVDTSNSNPELWHAPGDKPVYANGLYFAGAPIISYSGSWQVAGNALQALTGTSATYTAIKDASWQSMKTAIDQGQNVEAGTSGTSDTTFVAPGLVGHHAYMVVNIIPPPTSGLYLDPQAQVVLRNPWGYDPAGQPSAQGDGKNDGYITIPWSEFVQYFFGYYVDKNS
jgi:hypothetical protein